MKLNQPHTVFGQGRQERRYGYNAPASSTRVTMIHGNNQEN